MERVLRCEVDLHMIIYFWPTSKRTKVYEAVERYVYGLDDVLHWDGCEEDTKSLLQLPSRCQHSYSAFAFCRLIASLAWNSLCGKLPMEPDEYEVRIARHES